MQFGMKRVFRINLTQSFTTDICVYITGLWKENVGYTALANMAFRFIYRTGIKG